MRLISLFLATFAFSYLSCLSAEAQTSTVEPGTVERPADQKAASPAEEVVASAIQRPTVSGEPTEVRLLLLVLDIDGIDSANQNFSANVFMEARWNSPQLAHEGPGPRVMSTSSVWTPRLAIINQQQAWNAFPSYVEVSPDGEVTYRQKIWGWFSQPLDLRDFPFDQQTLTIHVAAAGLLQTEVSLTPLIKTTGRASGIVDKFSMPDFEVISWIAEPRAYFPVPGVPGNAGYIIEVKVQRSAGYFIWKLIVPLCFIVAISWVPRWLAIAETGTSIGIAATSFLTLVAYLFASTVMLPRVSYFTRMDLFILFSTLMVFISLLQTVLTSAFANESRARVLERINIWSRAIYPLLLLVVLGVSFAQ